LVIDLGAIAANWRRIAAIAAGAECGAVVKADAYGLGQEPVGHALWRAGARTFFVADITAALALRRTLPDARICVLHGVPAGAEGEVAEARLTPVLNTPGDIARWRGEAGRRDRPLPCLIHLDTGMNRLGLAPAEAAALAEAPAEHLAGLEVQAWMSHLACADDPANPMTARQRADFQDLRARLPAAPASLANSAGIFHGADYHADLVRPGIALYGANPTPWQANPMRPVIRILARIHQIRDVPAGATIGYDATHTVTRHSRIAALGMGYADGYPWRLKGRGQVRIGAHTAPIIARVSMDLLTVDVTDIPPTLLAEGGWVEVLGSHRDVDSVAGEAGTIGYEILTGLGRRYHRVHLPDV
jgi:alanine racemase